MTVSFAKSAAPAIAAVLSLVLVTVALLRGHEAGIAGFDSTDAPLSAGEAARLVVEAPAIAEVRLAPDASHVVFTLARGSVGENRYATELRLQRLDAHGRASGPAIVLERRVTESGAATFTPQWCPDARSLTYFGSTPSGSPGSPTPTTGRASAKPVTLMRYTLASRRASIVSRTTTIGTDYRWSPKGRFIAFTAPLSSPRPLDPRGGVAVTAQWRGTGGEHARSGLFAFELSTGRVQQVSPDALHVLRFDWAPDERALVVSAAPDAEGVPTFRTDLAIVDRVSRAVRPLVTRAGLDASPSWSPDGQWIAFTSHFGVPTYYSGSPAAVRARGDAADPVVRLGTEEEPRLSPYAPIFWDPDSQGFIYPSAWRMATRLVHASLATRSVAPVTTADDGPYEDRFSFSVDRRWMAFTRESIGRPPELFVQAMPGGPPHAVTQVAQDYPLTSRVRIDRVRWPSRDGAFTIHGLLLTPRSAWRDEPPEGAASPSGATTPGTMVRPLPTLVYLTGGPQMVRAGFAPDGSTSQTLTLAARGYAVLVPNTRGRGGYGEAFERGLRDGPSAARLPYEDAMAGVDWLVQRGIADPDRLGVYGHSYGGYLTAYLMTQTARFKAAVIYEAHVSEWLSLAATAPGTDWELLNHDLYGIRNLFDPQERARLIAESPALNMDRASTPALLLFGASASADRVGRPLFGALQRAGVLSELRIYGEGHVFARPAAIADALTRTADWFDARLRGTR